MREARNRYSRIRWPLLNDLKRRVGRDNLDMARTLERVVALHRRDPGEIGDLDTYGCQLAMTVFEGDYRNYFIDSADLVQFLAQAEIRETDLRGVIVSGETQATRGAFRLSGRRVQPGIYHVLSGAVHMPGEFASILFQFQLPDVASDEFVGGNGSLLITDGSRIQIVPLEHIGVALNPDGNIRRMIREESIVANLFMYMKCFPDSVRDGCPATALEPWEVGSRERSHRIGAHASIIDHSSPTPHLRRGHFRLLRSERFTKKRGHIVFVRATFVRGRAVTVDDVGTAREEMRA